MKKLNTVLILSTLLIITTSNSFTQNSNALIISEPANAAGIYRIAGADGWGGTISGQTYNAVFSDVRDACSVPSNVAGKLAIIETSFFCDDDLKALNAQMAMAEACIICNGDPVTGIPNLPEGDVAGQVDIPVYSMSFDDCAKLKAAYGTLDFEIQLTQNCETVSDPDVLWGTEDGEGDFSNGLGDWYVVSEGENSWYWTDDPSIPGAYSNSFVYEGTACNGYMLFPSDYYDNGGGIDSVGAELMCTGSNPDPTGIRFCTGSLYSPIIDLSGQDVDGLFCQFYHDVGYYYGGATSLIASYDGGITWPDTVYITTAESSEINNAEVYSSDDCVVVSASVNQRFEGTYSIPLQGYNGEENVQLQFKHYGGYYFASIDDVVLVDASYFDINVGRTFVSRAGASQIPLSQAQEIPFHLDLNNLGNLTAENVTIQVEAFAPDGSKEWETANASYVDYPPYCFINENNTFAETFTPTQIGRYTCLYSNVTPGDGNMANDTISIGFEMTERTWQSCPKPQQEEDGSYNHMWDGLIRANPTIDYAVGYPFYTPKGEGHFLNTVRFGIVDAPNNSGQLQIYLFEWDPTENSFPAGAPQQFHTDDLTVVGCMGENYFMQQKNSQPINSAIGTLDDVTITMAEIDPDSDGQPLFGSEGYLKPVRLKDDQQYLLLFVIDVTAGDTEDFEVHFIAADSAPGSNCDLAATNFALTQLGSPRRYGGMLYDAGFANNGSYDEVISTTYPIFWSVNRPWVEMDIHMDPLLTVGNEEVIAQQKQEVKIFPNPAVDQINVDINNQGIAADVTVDILDIDAKVIRSEGHENITRKILQLRTKLLTSGIYTLKVQTKLGTTSNKFIIAK